MGSAPEPATVGSMSAATPSSVSAPAGLPVRLKPALRLVWRGPTTVQIGLDPRRGTVLDGLTASDRDLVERLASHTSTQPSTDRERDLVALLDQADLLIRRPTDPHRLADLGPARARFCPDADAWSLLGADTDGWERLAGRRHRAVQLHDRLGAIGGSRVAAALTAALSASGVGRVGAPGAPPTRRTAAASDSPDLVVLLEADAADAARAGPLVSRDVAHLSVVVREGGVDVGPLVVPGQGACLRCLDLHRADRDPAWPRVLAQLLARRTARRPPAEEATLAQLAGALAALQVLGRLDALEESAPPGRAASTAAASATLEARLPDGLVTRRVWTTHPECGCRWPPRAPELDGRVTMSR